jgi:ATP phosphoribosyltransferase regulatory subunit
MDEPAAARPRISALQAGLPKAVASQALALVDFALSAQALESGLDLHIDFSELGSQGYHSGIVFQAYLADLDSPVASGGRYDQLLERLGCPAPAVGFSIMLSKLAHRAKAGQPAAEIRRLDPKQAFAERYAKAKELRRTGTRVAL